MKKVVVRHFHDGNDPDREVRGAGPGESAKYATRARIVDTETGEYDTKIDPELGVEIIAEWWAFCSPRDNPSRKLGRHIALQRLFLTRPEMAFDIGEV